MIVNGVMGTPDMPPMIACWAWPADKDDDFETGITREDDADDGRQDMDGDNCV